jgi:hypothetical protein
MNRKSRWMGLAVVACLACGPGAQKSGSATTPDTVSSLVQRGNDRSADTAPSHASASAGGTTQAALAPRPPKTNTKGAPTHRVLPDTERSGTQTPPQAPGDAQPVPTSVRALLTSASLVGKRVRVTGRCLGYGTLRAMGGAPRTRSDWQLEADSMAIWVTGPLPVGCSATAGATESSTLTALVAEDTVRGLGGPGRARRYLVVSRSR